MLYFNKLPDGRLEVLDGQQRITSLGRYLIGKFSVMIDGVPFKFKALPEDKKKLIEETKLLAYICEGTESEIKEWFEIINIGGVKLNRGRYAPTFSCLFLCSCLEIMTRLNSSNV